MEEKELSAANYILPGILILAAVIYTLSINSNGISILFSIPGISVSMLDCFNQFDTKKQAEY